jgi:hypothetical protein
MRRASVDRAQAVAGASAIGAADAGRDDQRQSNRE